MHFQGSRGNKKTERTDNRTRNTLCPPCPVVFSFLGFSVSPWALKIHETTSSEVLCWRHMSDMHAMSLPHTILHACYCAPIIGVWIWVKRSLNSCCCFVHLSGWGRCNSWLSCTSLDHIRSLQLFFYGSAHLLQSCGAVCRECTLVHLFFSSSDTWGPRDIQGDAEA